MGNSRRKSNNTPHHPLRNNSGHTRSNSGQQQQQPRAPGGDAGIGNDSNHYKSGGGGGGDAGSLSSSFCVENDDDVFLLTTSSGTAAAEAASASASSLDHNSMMNLLMADNALDTAVLMMDMESPPMLITWKGLGMIVAGLLLCAGFSVALGIFAGISISIQYFEATSPQAAAAAASAVVSSSSSASSSSSSSLLDYPHQYSLNQRTTIWDPNIASASTPSNSQNSKPLQGLNRRTSGKKGQQQQSLLSLPLVEESVLGVGGSSSVGDETTHQPLPSMDPSSSARRKPLSSPASSLPVENTMFFKVDPPRFSYQDMTRVKPRPCPPKHVAIKNSKSWFGGGSSRSYNNNHDHHFFGQQNETEPILGFDKWQDLQIAFQDANAYSADRFMRWNEFFAATEGAFDDGTTFPSGTHPSLYYEEDIVLRVCPGTTVRGRRSGPPIFVNAENIILECDDCTFEIAGGSHFSFGPHAKNVLFRGITFRGAKTTSLLFFHDGAEVSLEDCLFADNFATDKQIGTVADVNSTSIVNFYRCLMENGPNDKPAGLTSLSIRTKDGEIL